MNIIRNLFALLGLAAAGATLPAVPADAQVSQRWSLDAQRPTRLHRPNEIRRGVPAVRRQSRVPTPEKPYVAQPGSSFAPQYGAPPPAIERIPRT